MLRLGYSCHDAFPSSDANTQQIFWTLLEVSQLGVAVHLTVPSLRLPAGAAPMPAIAAHYGAAAEAVPDRFTVAAVGERAPRGSLARGWFDCRIAGALTDRGFDLIWTRDPVAAAVCARERLPLVFESYRPDLATRVGFTPWRRAVLGSPHLRGVIAHSRLAADAFQSAGVPAERLLVAHNGYAPALMAPRLSREDARAALGLPADRPLVVYTGHVGPRKGTSMLAQLAGAVPEVCFLIVGVEPGSEAAREIEGLARRPGSGRLMLRPLVPVAGVAAYLYAADCLIVPPTDEPLRRFRRTVLPLKLFTYLAAGRPILAPHLPDIAEVLTDDRTAVLVPADDVREAAEALRRLLSDPARQARLSASALAAAPHYTWAARAARIVPFLERARQG